MSLAPFVVNSVFAIELYLKTLGQLHDAPMRGHDLLKLFASLPPSAHQKLMPHFSSSQRKSDLSTLDDFRDTLVMMRGAFVEWRYLYETERTEELRLEPMIFVMEVLHNACKSHNELRKRT